MFRPARLLGLLGNLALLAAVAFGAMLVVPTLLGMHHYVILTKSMTGTYDRGSIIFDRAVPTSELRVGDPITYSPPPGQTAFSPVTHRIKTITRGQDGIRIFRTMGDANPVQDPWTFQLSQPTQDKVVFSVPYVGFALGVLSDKRYRMFLIGIPALLLFLQVMRGLVRDSREAVRAQTPGWGDIGELVHDAPPTPVPGAGDKPVLPVYLTLADGRSAADRRRPAPAPRAAVARGPRVPQLSVLHLHEPVPHTGPSTVRVLPVARGRSLH